MKNVLQSKDISTQIGVGEGGGNLSKLGNILNNFAKAFEGVNAGVVHLNGEAKTQVKFGDDQLASLFSDEVGEGETFNVDTQDSVTFTTEDNKVFIEEDANDGDDILIEIEDSEEEDILDEVGKFRVLVESDSETTTSGEYELYFHKMLEDGDKIKVSGDGIVNFEIDFDTVGAADLEINVGDFDDIPGMVAQIVTAMQTEGGSGELNEGHTISAEGFKREIEFEANDIIEDDENATIDELVAFMQNAIEETDEDDEYWVEKVGEGEEAQIRVYNLNPDLTEATIEIDGAGDQNTELGFDDGDEDWGIQGIGIDIEYVGNYVILTQIMDSETGEEIVLDDIEPDSFSLVCSDTSKDYDIGILTAGTID